MNMNGVQLYAYDAKIDGIYYNFSDTEASVTSYLRNNEKNIDGYSGNVVIPEFVTYNSKNYNVTSIDSYAFKYCKNLTSVTISNSITLIKDEAFYGCSSLTSISIPNSVTNIGSKSFSGCSSLTSISIPNSITYIGSRTFQNCLSLTDISIPNSVTSIHNEAFSRCSSLTNISIPNSVTSIYDEAFAYCSSLESFTFGTEVIEIANNIFNGHTPSKIIWLANNPPYNYEYVKGNINYVTNEKYSKLDNKIIYPNLSSIFESEGIKYVPISPSEKTCEAIDCTYDKTIDNLTIRSKTFYKGIEMTVNSIKPYIFYGNYFLKNVKWEYGEIIPKSAFQNCINLLTVDIADNTKNVEEYAFSGCSSLEKILFGSGVITIGNNAFENCIGLRIINIPKNLARIFDNAFKGCTKLKIANFEETKQTDNTHRINFENLEFSGLKRIKNKTYEFDVVDGDILSFGYSYDKGNGMGGEFSISLNGIEKIKLTNSKTDYFIHQFSKSQHVKLSFSLVSNVPYNNSDETNKGSVFNIEVGNEYILVLGSNNSSSLFSDCPLDSVHIGRILYYLTSKENGYSPFYNNKTLRSVFITNKETKISDNEFYGCAKLKNISIGEEITSIGNKAFLGCKSLEKYICGSKVKTIGQEAFAECTAIKKFICHAITPPTCGIQALDGINKWECTLSVPVGTTAAYQQAEQWKDFFFIDNDITGISKVMNAIAAPTHIYDLNGRKIENIKSGMNIIKMSDGTTKKIILK